MVGEFMKGKVFKIFIGGIVLFCIVVLIVFLLNHREVEIKDITGFHYSNTSGMNIYDRVSYDIECKKKCIATIMLKGVADEDAKVVEVSVKQMKTLESILAKYHVGRWDGFQENDNSVFDGGGFNLSITMKNGNEISAEGYMKWPKNYSKVVAELDSFFEKL